MPANPQIALGVQPMQLQMPDPNAGMNSLARMMQIRGMQDEQQVNALNLQEKQRGMERRNKLDSLLGGFSGKPEELGSTLLRGGFLDESQKVEKDRREGMKAEADADAKRVETAQKRVESWGQTMGWVRQNPTPESAVSAVRYLVTIGVIPQEMAQSALSGVGNDPQSITKWATQGFQAALSAKDQLPKYDTRNLGGTTQTTAIDPVSGQMRVVNSVANTQSPDSVASVAEQRRAHNMADARSREANAQGKVPSGYRQKPDGSLEFIPGGPADPNAAKKAAPTEFQGKAAMFGARAQEADRIIAELDGKYSPAGINTKQAVGGIPLIGGGVEAGANLMLSGASQKAEQAQRDFINAVLRLESGAVIAESEFNNAKKQYFPQPGDAKAVIAQKAANRKIAIQGLMNNARTSEPVKQAGGATGDFSPDIDALVKKYGGK
jgi:hypothetical protein